MTNDLYIKHLTNNNVDLARKLNELKIKNSNLDKKVIALMQKWQIEHEANVQLRTELEQRNAQYEKTRKLMVETLKSNTFNYRKLMEEFGVFAPSSRNSIQPNVADVDRQGVIQNVGHVRNLNININQTPAASTLVNALSMPNTLHDSAKQRRQSQIFFDEINLNQNQMSPTIYVAPVHINHTRNLTAINEENDAPAVKLDQNKPSSVERSQPSHYSTLLKVPKRNSTFFKRTTLINSTRSPVVSSPKPSTSTFSNGLFNKNKASTPSSAHVKIMPSHISYSPNSSDSSLSPSPRKSKTVFSTKQQNFPGHLERNHCSISSDVINNQLDKKDFNEIKNCSVLLTPTIKNTNKGAKDQVKDTKRSNLVTSIRNKENIAFETRNRPKRSRSTTVNYKEPNLLTKMRRDF